MTTQASNLHATAVADAHAHPAHPSFLAHHFDTPQQQFDSAKVGMWVFLATEILMFGGLFVAYAVWRANHPDVFLYAHTQLNWAFGFINTIFLISSSFTMAWAVRAAQLNQRKLCVILLLLTISGGLGFLCVKTVEYRSKWEHALWFGDHNQFHPKYKGTVQPGSHAGDHGAAPAAHGDSHAAPAAASGHEAPVADAHAAVAAVVAHVAPTVPPAGLEQSKITHAPTGAAGINSSFVTLPPNVAYANDAAEDQALLAAHGGKIAKHSLSYDELTPFAKKHTHQFFQIYFLMTGLHTLHVLIGLGLIIWILVRTTRGEFSTAFFTPVDLVGLYWHLVDLIWIFLFPLLYLIH